MVKEKKIEIYTKENVLKNLEAMAREFELVKKMLKLPNKLYLHIGNGSIEYSDKKNIGAIELQAIVRTNQELPKASEIPFSIGYFDSTSQTYFFLCDPKRRIIVIESLLYLGEGNWGKVARGLEKVLQTKNDLDKEKKKYNFIVDNMGYVKIH